jgi:hypothetical protein
MDFVEGSLWKQKKTMTGFKWKKRWIRADKNRLIQWHVCYLSPQWSIPLFTLFALLLDSLRLSHLIKSNQSMFITYKNALSEKYEPTNHTHLVSLIIQLVMRLYLLHQN